jgi:DNA topoisomerase IB
MLEFGSALPQVRKTVMARLDGRGLRRNRVLAAAIRLIDLGFFRVGSDTPTVADLGAGSEFRQLATSGPAEAAVLRLLRDA